MWDMRDDPAFYTEIFEIVDCRWFDAVELNVFVKTYNNFDAKLCSCGYIKVDNVGSTGRTRYGFVDNVVKHEGTPLCDIPIFANRLSTIKRIAAFYAADILTQPLLIGMLLADAKPTEFYKTMEYLDEVINFNEWVENLPMTLCDMADHVLLLM